MNKVTGTLDGVRWYRTSKQAARNAYNAGQEVLICAVNLDPFSMWKPGYVAKNDSIHTYEEGFDGLIRNYCWYNATRNETGRYAAFYVKERVTG